MTTNKFNIYQ